MAKITLEDLKSALYLDSESPSGLRWRTEKRSGKDGRIICRIKDGVAGGFCGYWTLTINYKTVLCHRAIMCLLLNIEPFELPFVDHENGNKMDNSLSNLRLSSPKYNSRNKKQSSLNKSGVTGVFVWEDKRRGTLQARAQWYDSEGKRHKRDFSFTKYGEDALKLAIALRSSKIEELNKQGAGYTDRHGGKE